MILLDTNVLSEFMRPRPEPRVVSWLDGLHPEQVWLSAISRAEIELGIALLPEGGRKIGLLAAARAMFAVDFSGRCLPFDDSAALRYADIVAMRARRTPDQRRGRPNSRYGRVERLVARDSK